MVIETNFNLLLTINYTLIMPLSYILYSCIKENEGYVNSLMIFLFDIHLIIQSRLITSSMNVF